MPYSYAVKKGKTPGVYKTWEECQEQVLGYKGSSHKKFKKESEALQFVLGNVATVSATVSINPSNNETAKEASSSSSGSVVEKTRTKTPTYENIKTPSPAVTRDKAKRRQQQEKAQELQRWSPLEEIRRINQQARFSNYYTATPPLPQPTINTPINKEEANFIANDQDVHK